MKEKVFIARKQLSPYPQGLENFSYIPTLVGPFQPVTIERVRTSRYFLEGQAVDL
jgi:hypothetical protein